MAISDFFFLHCFVQTKEAVVIDNLKIYYLADSGVLFQAEFLMPVLSLCHFSLGCIES